MRRRRCFYFQDSPKFVFCVISSFSVKIIEEKEEEIGSKKKWERKKGSKRIKKCNNIHIVVRYYLRNNVFPAHDCS